MGTPRSRSTATSGSPVSSSPGCTNTDDLKYVYVTLESLQDFLDRGAAIDGIEIRVRDPYDTDAFVSALQAAFGPHYHVQDWKELNRSLFSRSKLLPDRDVHGARHRGSS